MQYLLTGKIGGRSQIAQNSQLKHVRTDTSSTTWPKSWANIEDPVVLLERNFYGHPSTGLLWER